MTTEQILINDAIRFHLPEHMHQPIVRYVLHHLRPGHFLSAVLSNDLVGAVGRADDANVAVLKGWVQFLYNCEEVPGDCWGSPRHVDEWLR